jgi:hypothetical protein
MSTSFFDQLINVVGNLDFTGNDEFAAGTFVLLAAALAKLPEAAREDYLADIERGDLRQAVRRFEPCHPPGDRWVQ